jgi:hypothetical protein
MQVLEVVKKVLSLKTHGDKWVVEAVVPLVEIAMEVKELQAKKTAETAPMREAIKEVDVKYKPALDVLSEMDIKLRERVMKEHDGHESVSVDGIGELVFAAGSWEIDVVDIKKVEPQYITVDRKAIETDAKNGKAVFKGLNVVRGRSLRVITKS